MPTPLKRKDEVPTGGAARLLGVSIDSIRRLIERGSITARRVGPNGWWRVDVASLEAFLPKKRK